jgi:hypothetical protein
MLSMGLTLGSRSEALSNLSPTDSSVGMEDVTAVQQDSDTNPSLSTTIPPEPQNDPGVVLIVDGILVQNHDNPKTLPLPTAIESECQNMSTITAIETTTTKTQNTFPSPTTQTKRRNSSVSMSVAPLTPQLSTRLQETTDSSTSIDADTRPKKRARTEVSPRSKRCDKPIEPPFSNFVGGLLLLILLCLRLNRF